MVARLEVGRLHRLVVLEEFGPLIPLDGNDARVGRLKDNQLVVQFAQETFDLLGGNGLVLFLRGLFAAAAGHGYTRAASWRVAAARIPAARRVPSRLTNPSPHPQFPSPPDPAAQNT